MTARKEKKSKGRFSSRSTEPELIDGEDYSHAEFIETLADLRRFNSHLGGQRALFHYLLPRIETLGRRRVRLLDVGSGSADIPLAIVDWARERGIKLEFVVLDLNEIAIREAHKLCAAYPEIHTIRADALHSPFAPGSFDFVLASLFLHHFETPQAAKLISAFARTARVAVIINDLRRHPIAYYSIKLITRLFKCNRLVQHDAALSVLRGFTESDISEIAGLARVQLQVFRHFPYRLIVIGEPPIFKASSSH